MLVCFLIFEALDSLPTSGIRFEFRIFAEEKAAGLHFFQNSTQTHKSIFIDGDKFVALVQVDLGAGLVITLEEGIETFLFVGGLWELFLVGRDGITGLWVGLASLCYDAHRSVFILGWMKGL